jgi:hypothetical protein
MTLLEMKEKVYRLIEELSDSASPTEETEPTEEVVNEENTEEVVEETTEEEHLTDDPDYEKKINTCINIIQNELARIKKIPAKTTYNTETSQTGNVYTFASDIYQIDKIIGCNFTIIGKTIIFDEKYKGNVDIYYYKYPTPITEDTDDETYIFELDQDALEIMPFGVAGDMLKSDPSTNYGAYYSSRYNELKQMLDSRVTNGVIIIDESEALDF